MLYTQEITLDLDSNTAYTTVGAKQGDNNSREVRVHITSQGQPVQLTEDYATSAYFRFRKPDGKAVINACQIVGPATDDSDEPSNYVKLVFTAQTLAVAGRGYADITFMKGSAMISTVSFIVIIMASPSVAAEATSSNEFGLLNAVVEDATHTIYEAQAWAEGKRGNVEVFGGDTQEISKSSTVIDTINIEWDKFLETVGSRPGLDRTFVFTYIALSGTWNLVLTTIEGDTTVISPAEAVGSISDYYITLQITGADVPNDGDTITIHIQEHDSAYNNNAKYYKDQAAQYQSYLANLTVSAESLSTGADPSIIKTIEDDHYNFHFKLPKGETGDVNFMTFDIDSDINSDTFGQVIMYRPRRLEDMVDFFIESNINDANYGYLKVSITPI